MNHCYAWRSSTTGIPTQLGWRCSPKKGVSDILAVCAVKCDTGQPHASHGVLFAIEVKIGSDRLSAEQDGFLKNIEHVGGHGFVAKDLDSFTAWFSSIGRSAK